MATTSEVKAGLDAIAREIESRRAILRRAKDDITEQEVRIGNIPTEYQAVKEEIEGFSPTGAFETLAKSELAALTTEFQALKAAALAAKVALAGETEF